MTKQLEKIEDYLLAHNACNLITSNALAEKTKITLKLNLQQPITGDVPSMISHFFLLFALKLNSMTFSTQPTLAMTNITKLIMPMI